MGAARFVVMLNCVSRTGLSRRVKTQKLRPVPPCGEFALLHQVREKQHVGPSRRRRGDILQDGECFEGANPMSAVGV